MHKYTKKFTKQRNIAIIIACIKPLLQAFEHIYHNILQLLFDSAEVLI